LASLDKLVLVPRTHLELGKRAFAVCEAPL